MAAANGEQRASTVICIVFQPVHLFGCADWGNQLQDRLNAWMMFLLYCVFVRPATCSVLESELLFLCFMSSDTRSKTDGLCAHQKQTERLRTVDS